jgi:undecaprenyl-diphosphatase
VAVLLYFSRDIVSITEGVLGGLRRGKPLETPEARMGWMIGVGTVPVVIVGLLFKKHIETTLRSLYVIAGAMIALAVVLMLAEWFVRWRQRQGRVLREMKDLGWLDAITVGCAQCVALIPGSSRSGCTITGGLFMGMSRETAARFSFLLSLPAVFAAGIFELIKARHELLATPEHVHDLVVATFVSFVVGYASIAFLLGYLKKHTTWLFIIYRLALGGILLALLLGGKLSVV